MGSNGFSFSFSWGGRNATPAEIGERLFRSVEALQEIHPLFRSWWFTDLVAQEYVPIAEAHPRISSLIAQGIMRDDFDEPSPEEGYTFLIKNSTESTSETVNLEVRDNNHCRKKFFGNGGVFSTEYQEIPAPALIAYPVFKSAMMAMAQVWGATSAQAIGGDIGELRRKSGRMFAPAWMTYLAPPLLARITPPSGVLCEPTPDGGLLMIATEETFDPSNPDHMAASWAISDALVSLTRKEMLFS